MAAKRIFRTFPPVPQDFVFVLLQELEEVAANVCETRLYLCLQLLEQSSLNFVLNKTKMHKFAYLRF